VKSSSTPASTACEPEVHPRHPLAATCDRIIRAELPNFFRLYLNPFVVQTCLCLSRYVQDIWPAHAEVPCQSFLANSFDEALCGAIKLARYTRHLEGASPTGLVLDPKDRLGPFASIAIQDGHIEFIPGLVVCEDARALETARRSGRQFGFVVLVSPAGPCLRDAAETLRALLREQSPRLITCLDRETVTACRSGASRLLRELTPDIVIFDESFVDRQVPFAAFTAPKTLFDVWNSPGKTTFHSTTFQPNTIASLHFQHCLQNADPEFHAKLAAELERIERDQPYCASLLGTLYSPFLRQTIAALRFDNHRVRAAGHYIDVDGRKVFDGVAGVACSIRGHNPERYVEEMESLGDEARARVSVRLKELTGLAHVVPAVSGANAVENALRLGLVAQYPKRYVLALKNGFGGKTLLALTGTAHDSYKSHIVP
jgi:hypothetical protein